MPRPGTHPSPRRRAHRIAALLFSVASVIAIPAAVLAKSPAGAGPAATPAATTAATTAPAATASSAPSASPDASATFESVCGPVPAPLARCASLRRTDSTAAAAVAAVQMKGKARAAASPALGTVPYGPADLRSAYNLPSSGGNGRTVAIVDAYDLPTAESDLGTYRSFFGLSACTSSGGCFRKVNQSGGTSYPSVDSSWGGEIELDLDMVSAVCPDCKILLVEANSANMNDLAAGVETAVRLGADAVSNSYGAVEWAGETSLNAAYNRPGVVMTAATGDAAYADGVEFPASSPYVVAVGGTSLTHVPSGGRAWTETVWGKSPFTSGTGSGCSHYETKPYWQTDTGCTHRTTADVSAVADPNTGVLVFDNSRQNGGGWMIYGGTSAAAPIVAAAFAVTGKPAPGSYAGRLLYASPASAFNDVTSGSNGTCSTYLCRAATGYDGPTGRGTLNGTAAITPDVADVAAGSQTSCALRADGTASCWGYDGAGEAEVPPGTYVALSTGDSHSCAIDTAGALHCWGANTHGEASPPAGNYVAVAAGATNSCAIDTSGAPHCWGDGTTGINSPPGGQFRTITVGTIQACGIDMSQFVECWGQPLGGTAEPGGNFVAVSAGKSHACALTVLGAITCWGDNSHGQLTRPTSGIYIDLDAGMDGTCALNLTGAVRCWGDNTNGQNSPPTGLASRVALGKFHGCEYQATGIKCWGSNATGQVIPLLATALPDATRNVAYATDVPDTMIVPGATHSLTAGSLPPGMTLSAAGHLSGTSSVAGLYSFTVKATNGIAPQASRALTLLVYDPDAAPGPPTSVVATGTDRAVLVTWAAPAPYFGPAVTGYTVTSEPPTTSCVMTMAMSCSFSSLTNRQQFTFTVTAYNPNGHGAATVTSTPLAGATYFAVTPNRIVDSRTGTRLNLKASLVEGTPVQFAVVGQSINPALNIPPGAIAVTGNLTVTNQGSGGYLAMTPDQPVGIPTTSTLNFPRGDNRANAVTIPLRASGKLWVTFVGAAGKNADVIFDVTGYFMENSRGSTYFPLTPNRLADSRAATRAGFAATLSEGVPASFPVVDQHPGVPSKNVPANAIAVTGNLTVTNQGSAGYLAITPTKPAGVPGTSTLNFPMHDNRANSVTVPISGGRLWVTFEGKAGARADAIFDVTGYFVADATGATYYAVTPNRLVDSRKNTWIGLNASLISGTASKFKVENRTGNSNLDVPTGAIAVTGNLTVTKQGSAGYLTLTPADPGGVPGTSTLNFPMNDDRANAVTVTLSTAAPKSLWVEFVCTSSARTDVIFDVTGYFIQ